MLLIWLLLRSLVGYCCACGLLLWLWCIGYCCAIGDIHTGVKSGCKLVTLLSFLWYDKLWGPSQRVVTLFKGNSQKADKFWDKVSYLCLSTNDKSAAHIVSEQELKRSVVPVFVSPPYLERQLMSVGEGGSLEETWCPQFSKFENISINCGHANFHLQPLVWCPICL